MSAVRLSKRVKVIVLHLGVGLEEVLEEVIHVGRNSILLVVHPQAVGETGACRLVNVEEVSSLVP